MLLLQTCATISDSELNLEESDSTMVKAVDLD